MNILLCYLQGLAIQCEVYPKFLGLAAPMILDLDAFSLYLQLLEYACTLSSNFCSSSGVEAIRAKSSA